MKSLDSKTKSLMRDFDALARKHSLQNVTLQLENGIYDEAICFRENRTFHYVAPVQWTPLKKVKTTKKTI